MRGVGRDPWARSAKGDVLRIFISYSSSDRHAVESLASDLVRLGHQVWFDQALKGGQDWWDEILEQLRSCDVLVMGVSKASLASDACQRELTYGLALNRAIVPVIFSAGVAVSLLPAVIQRRHCVKFTGDAKDALLELVGALNAVGSVHPLPTQLPAPPEIPLSPLASIAEQLNQKSLSEQQQVLIGYELKKLCARPDTAEGALELVNTLLGHESLLASVKPDLEALLVSLGTPEPAQVDAGLSAKGALGEGAPEGILTVKRKKALWNHRGGTYGVYIDGERVGRLNNGEQTELEVTPGTHVVQIRAAIWRFDEIAGMSQKSEELAVKVQAGESVILSCQPTTWGGIKLKRGEP